MPECLSLQSARSAQRGNTTTHSLPRFHFYVIRYTGRNAHTGDQTFKKGVAVVNLALKYRHIFKNVRKKKFSAKRHLKNGQKKPNGQPKNCTANQLERRPNFRNLAEKRPIRQPWLYCREWSWLKSTSGFVVEKPTPIPCPVARLPDWPFCG